MPQRISSMMQRAPGRRGLLLLLALAILVMGMGVGGFSLAQASPCTNVLTNGGFESDAGWTLETQGNYSLLSDYLAHSGLRAAYLAGTNNAVDSVSTTLALPAGNQSISLHFWWQIFTEEAGGGYDGLSVQVLDSAGNPLKMLFSVGDINAVDNWQQASLDLSEFAGQTVQLKFQGQSDSSLTSDFFVDDVEVTACDMSQLSNRIFLPFTSR